MTLFFAPAPVAQIFWPLITQSSPSRLAVVRIAPISEPASGSDIEIDSRISPASSFGIQYCFCSSVPLFTRFRPLNTLPPNAVKKSKLLRESSSAMTTMSMTLPPRPPYSSGKHMRSRPISIHASYSS